MDFMTDLPTINGQNATICTIVDRFSKMARFIPIIGDASAKVVATHFFDSIVRQFGIPRSIVSDRDKRFTGQFWQTLWNSFGTSLNLSTAFHPQTDGQSERAHRTV